MERRRSGIRDALRRLRGTRWRSLLAADFRVLDAGAVDAVLSRLQPVAPGSSQGEAGQVDVSVPSVRGEADAEPLREDVPGVPAREIDRVAGLISTWFGDQPDTMLDTFTFMANEDMMLMLGPHSRTHGFCWCQPRMIPHGQHAHPLHNERPN